MPVWRRVLGSSLAAAALIAGGATAWCYQAGPGPLEMRLTAGGEAVLDRQGPETENGLVIVAETSRRNCGSCRVAHEGTRVRIESDRAWPRRERLVTSYGGMYEPWTWTDRAYDCRPVYVTLLDGEHKGYTGYVRRIDLSRVR